MATRIREYLGSSKINSLVCEQNGLKPFDQTLYKQLEILGRGGFGVVWRCLEIATYSFKAVKYMDIGGVEFGEDKIRILASFLIEKQIIERIIKEESSCLFPKFYGAFYKSGPDDTIESLILVSEAGNFNLAELINCRKEDFNKDPPYSPEETFSFLVHMIPAFCSLQRARLYHSDIKPGNIVYSERRKSFMLIDFGVAKEIPQVSQPETFYALNEFAADGTKSFNSPEKNKYWESMKIYNQVNNNSEGALSQEESLFDPFNCDMWAFGVTLERMLGKTSNAKDCEYLQTILTAIKNINWRERWSATKVFEFLKSKGVAININIYSQEAQYLQKLKHQRMSNEGLIELQKKYKEASLPNEQLEVALEEFNVIKEQNPEKGDESQEFADVLDRLGDAYSKLGKHNKSLEVFEKRKRILIKMGISEDDLEMGLIINNIATCKSRLGLYSEALAEFGKSLG